MKSYRNDTRYVAQRELLKRRYRAQGLSCASCGNPFLWEFEDRKLYPDFWKDARSFTADHLGGRQRRRLDGPWRGRFTGHAQGL